MSADGFDEPGKYWSAVQAAAIMFALTVPLVWSLSFSRTLAPAPLTVALVAAPPPPEPEPVAEPEEVERVRQEVREAVAEQRQAEIARRRERERQEREEERQRLEEERARRAAEVKERLLEQERERQERLAAEARRRQEEQAERDRRKQRAQEERDRQRELDERREAEAAERAETERQAKLKAAANKVVMNRFITGIHDQVQRHVSEPHGVPKGIKAEFRISIGPNGHLRIAPVLRAGSGNKIFDNAALRAIVRSGQDGFALPDDPDLQKEFEDIVIVIVAGALE